jgi:hypothetical protein
MRRLATVLAALVLILGLTATSAGKPVKSPEGWSAPTRGLLDCTISPGLNCAGVVVGDNIGAPNNVSFYGCTSWNESGGEVVYEFVIERVCYSFTATLLNTTADLDVFIVGSCDENDCIAYGDTYATSPCIEPGTFYVVVDGYNGAEGYFELEVECEVCGCPEPPCAPMVFHCNELDFNLDRADYTTEACEGGASCWEWGMPLEGTIPGIACEDKEVTNILGTFLIGPYTTCGERAIVGPFSINADCWCLELCHYYDTEPRYDGGNVKISIDGGATWEIIVPARGYDDIGSSFGAACIADQPIFTGHGSAHSFQTDCFDLSEYTGKEVLIAFDFGADGSTAYVGWYIQWVMVGGHNVSPTEDRTWGSIKSLYK